MEKKIVIRPYESQCGRLLLGSFGSKLCLCDWQSAKTRANVHNRLRRLLGADFEPGSSPIIETAVGQLDEYFAGKRQEFDVDLIMAGTDFQKAVWDRLLHIPYGHTASYREIASTLSHPQAVRAVANANGANALSIFIPCHRVIGINGQLTGYAGGLAAKRHLLDLERHAHQSD